MNLKHISLPIALLTIVVPQAQSGDLSKKSYSRSFEWESTDCYKPDAPYVFSLDEFTRYQIQSYLDDLERYRNCVESEAADDFSQAQKKMAEAIEEGRDEAIEEVDRELEDLELQLSLLR